MAAPQLEALMRPVPKCQMDFWRAFPYAECLFTVTASLRSHYNSCGGRKLPLHLGESLGRARRGPEGLHGVVEVRDGERRGIGNSPAEYGVQAMTPSEAHINPRVLYQISTKNRNKHTFGGVAQR